MTLYNITQVLRDWYEHAIDKNTGELTDESLVKIDALEIQRENKIEAIALLARECTANIAAIDLELERLDAMKHSENSKLKSLCWLIERSVPINEKIKTPLVSVSYRQSQSVNIPDGFDLESLYMMGLAEEKRTVVPDKRAIKQALQDAGSFADRNGFEISLQTKWNLQIK